MGLDMYAFTTTKKINRSVDFKLTEDCTELHYWRKHPNLHGWMKSLYEQKGGKDEDFNCSNLKLTMKDLERLQKELETQMLPFTSGIFFGESDGSEKELQEDLDFVHKAKQEIREGKTVVYSAWW